MKRFHTNPEWMWVIPALFCTGATLTTVYGSWQLTTGLILITTASNLEITVWVLRLIRDVFHIKHMPTPESDNENS